MPGLLRNYRKEGSRPTPQNETQQNTPWLTDIREAVAAHDFLINRYDELHREITLVERELARVRRVISRRGPPTASSSSSSSSSSEQSTNNDDDNDDNDHDDDTHRSNDQSAASALLQELFGDDPESDEDPDPVNPEDRDPDQDPDYETNDDIQPQDQGIFQVHGIGRSAEANTSDDTVQAASGR